MAKKVTYIPQSEADDDSIYIKIAKISDKVDLFEKSNKDLKNKREVYLHVTFYYRTNVLFYSIFGAQRVDGMLQFIGNDGQPRRYSIVICGELQCFAIDSGR